ncbi:MAG: ABC transporter substrate-binding protein [Methyloligellaceae bacterium]
MSRLFTIAIILSSLLYSPLMAGDVTIDAWPDFDSHFKDEFPKINKVHKDLKLKYRMNKHGDHHKKLTTHLATGSGAGNVVAVDVGFIGSFINAGGFVNLSEAPYNADKIKEGFVSYAWTQGQGTDGNQYAVPIDIGPGVMYYRRDALEKVGAKIEDVIKDWDSYIEYGRKLKEHKIFLIADAADVANVIYRTTVKPGEGLYFDKDGNSLITSERFVKAFTVAKKVRDEKLDAQITAWTNEWYDAFKSGNMATQLSGAWLLGHLKNWMAPKTAGKWGVSNLPDGLFGSWGGSFLAIPKQAKNKEDAWKVIKYLTSTKDAQISSLKKIGAMPSLKTTYTDKVFAEPIPFLNNQNARELFAEVAKTIKPVKPMKGDLIARDVVNAALTSVLNEGKDIKEALKEAELLVKRRVK